MTLRDTFAAAVLVGMPPGETPEQHRELATKAYAMADAMLAVRGVDHAEQLVDVKERLHVALGNLRDVVDTAQGDGPNMKKIREALEEVRLAVAGVKKCLPGSDVGGGGRRTHPRLRHRARSRWSWQRRGAESSQRPRAPASAAPRPRRAACSAH